MANTRETPLSVPPVRWLSVGNLNVEIGFLVDRLSVLMLLVVTGVGSLIHLFSVGYMKEDPGYARYFAYLNLFVVFMLVLVLGSSFPVLFIGWDFDPRIRLDPRDGGRPKDDRLGFVLEKAVKENSRLEIGVLQWDLGMLRALGRGLKPIVLLDRRTPDRLTFAVDTNAPPDQVRRTGVRRDQPEREHRPDRDRGRRARRSAPGRPPMRASSQSPLGAP